MKIRDSQAEIFCSKNRYRLKCKRENVGDIRTWQDTVRAAKTHDRHMKSNSYMAEQPALKRSDTEFHCPCIFYMQIHQKGLCFMKRTIDRCSDVGTVRVSACV